MGFHHFLMKSHFSPLFLLLGFFCLLSISRSASSSPSSVSRESLGISPEDLKYFKSDIIKCKDGSKKFTKAQLNDDFCDCQDGTDEPGTSACARGKFYCKNSGHAPLSIFSSRVNDGICDCCDGSDEYDGKVKCQNTCWEAGKAARDKLVKKIATYKEGVIIRKKEIEQAKESIPKDQSELSKLKSDEKILKGLVQQLKDRKEQIEKAEERERLEKEKEEKKKKESEEKLNGQEKESTESQHDEHHDTVESSEEPSVEQDESEFNDHDAVEAANDDDSDRETSHSHGAEKHAANDQKTMVETESIEGVDESNEFADEVVDESNTSPDVAKQAIDESENTEGLSKEELGRLVASRWTGERSGDETKDVNDAKKEEQTEAQETEENEPDEDYDGYNSSEDNEKYNEDVPEEEDVDDDFDHSNSDDSYKSDVEDQADFSDITTTGSSSWLNKIQQTVRNILQAVNLFQTPVDKSEAAHVRKEYDDASAKLSKIQSRISSLNQKLERDYGPEKEFYSFYDRCFENKQNKYVYKVCPFKKASQVEGHSTTQLGHWDKFEDSYRTMLFSNGDKCWNGPDRSLKVKLRCGLNNELTDVDEPSRCEYVAILSTPALCQEEKLKELQNKLDLMNKEQPNSHDEL